MSIENTSNLFPEGDYVMEVSQVPEKQNRKGFVFWDFNFTTKIDGEPADYQESIPIWLCGPIFKVLGYPEVRPGSFDVDAPAALGRQIACKVVHMDVKGTPRARMMGMVLSVDMSPRPAVKDDTPDFLKPSGPVEFPDKKQIPI